MALVRWLEESPIRPEEAGAVRCTRCGTQLDFTNVRICCVCAELYCYMHCVSELCDRCYSPPDSEAEVADAQTRMVPATHEAAVAVAKRPRSRSRAGRSKAIRIRSPAPVSGAGCQRQLVAQGRQILGRLDPRGHRRRAARPAQRRGRGAGSAKFLCSHT